jgi:phosphoglycerol geranylgeranyltransferase
VRSVLSIPLIVGGGIRSGKQAEAALEAGADVLVTGTIAEKGDFSALREIIQTVRARRRRA